MDTGSRHAFIPISTTWITPINKEDSPILRWDNKEEFRSLKTYPHHHHDDRGNIQPSPLKGEPQVDIVFVLKEIENFLAGTD